MKKQLFVFAGLLIITVALVSWNTRSTHASKFAPATVINDLGCALFDENQILILASSDHAVITNSGKGTLKCSVKGIPNSTGAPVKFSGFLCGTLAGFTTDTQEVISTSGNATLTCLVH